MPHLSPIRPRAAHLLPAAGALLSLLACTPAGETARAEASGAAKSASAPDCEVVAKERALPDDAREASGITAGRTHPDAFWTVNDGGNDAQIIAFDLDGKQLGVQTVVDAKNNDWEDIATGPCAAGSCLYIADIGDNDAKRKHVTVWRVPEPDPTAGQTAAAERFDARYPGAARDAEALFVLPGGEVYLVTKGTDSPVELYRWPTPLRADSTVQLELVRTLAPQPEQTGDRVTGAGATPDGEWVALRTYAALFLWPRARLLGNGAAPEPFDLAPLEEDQGEGVAIGSTGNIVMTSEGHGKKRPPSMSLLRCRLR